MCTIKSFVFIDLETTGLPYTENNQTKITEISLIALTRSDLESGNLPRVLNKLTLCLNPRRMISPAASNITGLWNDMLEEQKHFSTDTYNLLMSFIQHLYPPVCLIAHNGNFFDYPILSAELFSVNKQFPEYIYCVDSIPAFKSLLINRSQDKVNEDKQVKNNNIEQILINKEPELIDDDDELYCTAVTQIENDLDALEHNMKGINSQQIINETTPKSKPLFEKPNSKFSFKNDRSLSKCMRERNPKVCRRMPFSTDKPKSLSLVNIYEFLMGKEPREAHKAENDVMFLIECASKMNRSFIEWCDSNAVLFSTIPKMEPGKRIGIK